MTAQPEVHQIPLARLVGAAEPARGHGPTRDGDPAGMRPGRQIIFAGRSAGPSAPIRSRLFSLAARPDRVAIPIRSRLAHQVGPSPTGPGVNSQVLAEVQQLLRPAAPVGADGFQSLAPEPYVGTHGDGLRPLHGLIHGAAPFCLAEQVRRPGCADRSRRTVGRRNAAADRDRAGEGPALRLGRVSPAAQIHQIPQRLVTPFQTLRSRAGVTAPDVAAPAGCHPARQISLQAAPPSLKLRRTSRPAGDAGPIRSRLS